MKITDQLHRELSADTVLRINQIDEVEEFELIQIERGLLAIHASWSGYSAMYGKAILNLLDKAETKNFEIAIIDIDSISPEKQTELLGFVCHGYFESIWIENGKIERSYRDNNQATELPKFINFLSKKVTDRL